MQNWTRDLCGQKYQQDLSNKRVKPDLTPTLITASLIRCEHPNIFKSPEFPFSTDILKRIQHSPSNISTYKVLSDFLSALVLRFAIFNILNSTITARALLYESMLQDVFFDKTRHFPLLQFAKIKCNYYPLHGSLISSLF